MKKFFSAVIVVVVACCSLVFAQAGDHFAEGAIASIENGVIILNVSGTQGETMDLVTQDFTSYELNGQQITLDELAAGTNVRVAYYEYPDRGNVLTHLYVLE